VRQVLKLPDLVEHYVYYKLVKKDGNVLDFFKMHYLEDHGIDSDHEQDMKLPFKTHHFSVVSLLPTHFPPKKMELSLANKNFFEDKRQNFAYSINYYPSVFLKIWQPPKI
jgi:hypothetical protein